MTDLYYDDPLASAPVKMKSRMPGDAIIPAHDVESLPGTVEGDIGASKGYLAAIAGAPSTAAVTTVPASATVVTLAASKASRYGLMIANNSTSTSTLWVKFGTAASLSSWSVPVEPGGYYEMPPRYYSGVVTGIWSNATGDAHVTETG
jgi:hypothetical protein